MSTGPLLSSPLYCILLCKQADLCCDAAFSGAHTGEEEVLWPSWDARLLNCALDWGTGGVKTNVRNVVNVQRNSGILLWLEHRRNVNGMNDTVTNCFSLRDHLKTLLNFRFCSSGFSYFSQRRVWRCCSASVIVSGCLYKFQRDKQLQSPRGQRPPSPSTGLARNRSPSPAPNPAPKRTPSPASAK